MVDYIYLDYIFIYIRNDSAEFVIDIRRIAHFYLLKSCTYIILELCLYLKSIIEIQCDDIVRLMLKCFSDRLVSIGTNILFTIIIF